MRRPCCHPAAASRKSKAAIRVGLVMVPALILHMSLSCKATAQQAWPNVPLPKKASPFVISGGTVDVNGLPMRMQGFLSPDDPGQVQAWFRKTLGSPLAENRLGSKLILGRAQAGHYTTVQLEPAGKGTRGIISVTPLAAMQENLAREQVARERWLSRLPSGSQLVSHLQSADDGRQSSHLAFVNSHDTGLNRERIVSLLLDEGLKLEHEARPSATADAAGDRKLLFFKGRGKDAIATIFRNGSEQTAIVLNTVTTIEQIK